MVKLQAFVNADKYKILDYSALMENAINNENWTYTHYALGDIKAKICLGGDLAEDGQYQELYFVSILDAEHQEISQTEHQNLESALNSINHGHKQWNFIDETKMKKSDSGCGSCVAH